MTKTFRFALSVLTASVLAACGGGGGGGSDNDSGDPETAATIGSAIQAQKAVARVVVGAERYDALNGDLIVQALEVMLSVASEEDLVGSAACDNGVGSVSYTLVDADRNGRISEGDHGTFNLAGCQIESYQPLTGEVKLRLTDIDDLQDLVNGTGGGKLGVRMTYNDVKQPASNLTLDGSYSLTLSRASSSSPYVTTTRFPELVATNGDVAASFDAFLYKVVETETGSTTDDISGEAVVTIDGLGEVGYELDLVEKGDGDMVGGVVRMTNADHTLLVSFAANDVINIEVDNGKDGSVEYNIATTLAELDALFTTP